MITTVLLENNGSKVYGETMDELLGKLNENFSKAVKLAESIGEIVGWVSRTSPSSIAEEGGLVVFDVEPIVYFREFLDVASTGSYLALVDIKTCHIVSLNVVSVERRDVLAELELPDTWVTSPTKELSGLLTKTRVKAKPLLAYDPWRDEVTVANYVIEPQSPVVKLKDTRVIHKILGLPDKGVFLGFASVGDRPLFDCKAPLFLPLKAFYQHVLILGTTGSGKTTLLKNMIASLLNNTGDNAVSLLIMDPNKDYVTIPLKPVWEFAGVDRERELKAIENTEGFVKRPKGMVVILPVTRFLVEEFSKEGGSWAKLLKRIGLDYVDSTYTPIAAKHGWRVEFSNVEIREEDVEPPLRYAKVTISLDYNGSSEEHEVFVIPYGFRFKDMHPQEFISLNPYFTRQAKDGLIRLLNYIKQNNVGLNTLYELYESLKEARLRIENKSVKIYSQSLLVDLVKDLAIHKSTLENIVRQIGSVIDTGLFDIEAPEGRGEDRYLHEPPIDYLLENHFRLFKGYPIVVDLEYVQEHSFADPEKTISIVAFRILNNVFKWKLVKTKHKVVTQPVIIVFDEAHRFFPSKGGGREEYIENVSSMIDRIARLGRARRLGLIFSTHSPKDVHDIILQLTNTKIILRMDKTQIPALDVPEEYRDLIQRAGDRVGLVKSHVYRTGYAVFKTPLPLLGHFDLSAM